MLQYGKTKRMLFLLVCAAVLVFVPLLQADENAGSEPEQEKADDDKKASPEKVQKLGEMVVIAPKDERDLLETPAIESSSLEIAISVVDGDLIRLMDADALTDALDLAPGVLTETRGRKEKNFSSFRGQMYPYPDYALNGVWQRMFWEIPAFFPAAAIESIEVLRSGGAIMVGPNSGLVGAINVVTRRFDEPTTEIDAQLGSFNTLRSSVVYGDVKDNIDYTTGAHVYTTAGPDGEHAAEAFASVFGTGGWDINDTVHMEGTAFIMSGSRELRTIQDPGLLSFQNRREEFSPLTSYGAIVRTLFKHESSSSTELDIGYVAREEDYLMQRTGFPDKEHEDDDSEFNLGALHARELSDSNTIRIGLQYNHWLCPDGKRFFVGSRMNIETYSAVVMDEQEWDTVTLDAGLRLTRSWYWTFTDTTFDIIGNKLASNVIKDEWGDPAVTATVGLKVEVDPDMSLYGHIAAGTVEAPPGAVEESGGTLGRETRFIVDGGMKFSEDGIGSFSAGAFTTIRFDAVVLTDTVVTVGPDTFNTYANNDVLQYGVELEAESVVMADAYSLFGNATIMQSRKQENSIWARYREIPEVVVSAGLRFEKDRYDVNVFMKYVSPYENKRFAEDGNYHPLGDFIDLNVTAGMLFGEDQRTRLYISLENLLNDTYSTVVGFPDYGFQALIGVRHRM